MKYKRRKNKRRKKRKILKGRGLIPNRYDLAYAGRDIVASLLYQLKTPQPGHLGLADALQMLKETGTDLIQRNIDITARKLKNFLIKENFIQRNRQFKI